MSNSLLPERKTRLILEGDLLLQETVTIENVVRAEEWLQQMQSAGRLTTPALPIGCVYYQKVDETATFVVQETPTVRTVNLAHYEESHARTRIIAIPSLVYIFHVQGERYHGGKIFMARGPITDLSDEIYRSFLPNQYPNGNLCEGGAVDGFNLASGSSAARCNAMVEALHNARFNDDLGAWRENWPSELGEYRERIQPAMADWEAWTNRDESPLARLSNLTLRSAGSLSSWVDYSRM